jgi:hypothetical protein
MLSLMRSSDTEWSRNRWAAAGTRGKKNETSHSDDSFPYRQREHFLALHCIARWKAP